jgi:selenocysteine lyase/cysteine desulfurase
MEANGVDLSVVPCSPTATLDPEDIRKAFRKNTKLVILTHASNVTGTIMPIEAVGAIIKEKSDALFCVDAAQTAGVLPINVEKMFIDLLAFTGHKSLYGPQGTGGLYICKGVEKRIRPMMMGGTGSRSEFEEQPDFMPDKYESGTPNTIGYAGLSAGANFVLKHTPEVIRAKEQNLASRFLDQLKELKDDVTIYGPRDACERTAVVSFNVKDVVPSDAALHMEEMCGILCRPGLHCAPAAHRTINTFPQGTIRFSFGFFNNIQDVDRAADAVRGLLKH